MEDIQTEEELAAINHALKCVRERYRTLTPRPLSTPQPVPQPPVPSAARQSFRIRNWREYNQALRQRANLTLWADDAAIQSWCTTQRSGQIAVRQPTVTPLL